MSEIQVPDVIIGVIGQGVHSSRPIEETPPLTLTLPGGRKPYVLKTSSGGHGSPLIDPKLFELLGKTVVCTGSVVGNTVYVETFKKFENNFFDEEKPQFNWARLAIFSITVNLILGIIYCISF